MTGITHPEGCRCPGCLPGQYVMRSNRPARNRQASAGRNRNAPSGSWGILVPFFAAMMFAVWPYAVWHGCKYGGGSGLSGCGAESEWVWNGQTWAACGVWWGLIVLPFAVALVGSAAKKRAVRPPKGRLRVEATTVSQLKPPPASVCAPGPICLHRNAVKVDSSVVPGLIWQCWCPDCEEPLPANWKRPCCGTEPESPHWYSCPRR